MTLGGADLLADHDLDPELACQAVCFFGSRDRVVVSDGDDPQIGMRRDMLEQLWDAGRPIAVRGVNMEVCFAKIVLHGALSPRFARHVAVMSILLFPF